MKIVKAIIFERKDLLDVERDFYSVKFWDCKKIVPPFVEEELVLFVDDDGRTKVLKNRFGTDGVVVTRITEAKIIWEKNA